jgi:hypothetical protein
MALLYMVKWFALNALDLAGSLQTVLFTRWVSPLALALTRTRARSK